MLVVSTSSAASRGGGAIACGKLFTAWAELPVVRAACALVGADVALVVQGVAIDCGVLVVVWAKDAVTCPGNTNACEVFAVVRGDLAVLSVDLSVVPGVIRVVPAMFRAESERGKFPTGDLRPTSVSCSGNQMIRQPTPNAKPETRNENLIHLP